MLVVLTQTIRHLYVRYYYDRTSVLDKYHESETDKYIKKSFSLDSLLMKYDKAFNDVKSFEKGKTNREIDSLKRIDDRLYETKHSYRAAIEDWEGKENKINEVIVFWIIGFIVIIIGAFFYYKKIQWFGLSLIIVGLIEMIWWSSPDLSLGGATLEYLKYLNTKIILSSIALVVVILLWFLDKNEQGEIK